MNLFEYLPIEWQDVVCPGNGHGFCGAQLREEPWYSPQNSAWVIRRVCHYGHSASAVIPPPPNEDLDMRAKKYNYNTQPKPCAECGKTFGPKSNNQILCLDYECKKHRWTRTHYVRFLVKNGIEREEAHRLALIKHPRYGSWQDEKRNNNLPDKEI